MRPRANKYLRDILDAALLVTQFADGKGFAEYESDVLLRSAVERQLTILCEAMAQLAVHDQSLATRITDHDAVIGMRIVGVGGTNPLNEIVEAGLVATERLFGSILEEVHGLNSAHQR